MSGTEVLTLIREITINRNRKLYNKRTKKRIHGYSVTKLIKLQGK